ncbi:unnamed protein product, partial [Mesorhabditis belari]|uniref:Uncharacterized protein n=1 Tax=Mesorhabditis belari TaxID=2138241 RepID=A0AAF3J1I0_9BILA
MRFFLLFIAFLGFNNAWKVLLTADRTLDGIDFEFPIYSVIWGDNETDTPLERFQAFRAWEIASAQYLWKQQKTAMSDYRNAMFCYPGRSPFGNSNDTGSLPECDHFFELHSRCLNETEEFLEMIPNDSSLKEALFNNGSTFIEMLKSQKNRLGQLIGFYPNFHSPMLSPAFDRIAHLIGASEAWRAGDSDLWTPSNSTVLPRRWPDRHWRFRSNETWNNETLQNFTKGFGSNLFGELQGGGVRDALWKKFRLNFTDDQWENLTNLIKNNWRDLGKGGENSTAAKELEEIVSESGASDSTMNLLKQLLQSGNVLAAFRGALGQQAQTSGDQFSQMLNNFMSAMKNVHQNNVNQAAKATANTQDLATGTLGTFFGGLQSVLTQLQG